MRYSPNYRKIARFDLQIALLEEDLKHVQTPGIRKIIEHQLYMKGLGRNLAMHNTIEGITGNTQPTEAHPSPQVRKAAPKPKKVKEKKPSGRRKRHEKGA